MPIKTKVGVLYLISNIAAPFSYNLLAREVGIHDRSAKEFIRSLEQAYLISELKQFSWSVKKQKNNKKKPFTIDNGFIKLAYKFSTGNTGNGTLLKNLIFIELTKAGRELYFGPGSNFAHQ